MDDALNDPGRLIRLDSVRRTLGDVLVGKMRDREDDGALFFQEEFENKLAEQFRAERPEHQFANGGFIPIRGTVPALDGEIGFFYMYDHAGIAKWHTSGGVDDIPRVSLERWRQDYKVHRMALGWSEDVDDIARAERNGFPIQFIEVESVFDGLDKLLDDVIFEGDSDKALPGITNQPNITVLNSAAGAAGAIRWTTLGATSKTFAEIVGDVDSLVNTMRAVTRNLHRPNQIWMSDDYWSRLSDVFLPNTERTVRRHLEEKYPDITFRAVRRLAEAGQFAGPILMGVKFVRETELWAEVPGNKIPGELKRVDERVSGYNKTYTAGVVTPYPLRIIRMDFDTP